MTTEYADVIELQDSIGQKATVTITPVLSATELSLTHKREFVKIMIEARGPNGEYSRAYTERTTSEHYL